MNVLDLESIRVSGTRLPANGVPASGSRIAGRPEKSPLRIASVATLVA